MLQRLLIKLFHLLIKLKIVEKENNIPKKIRRIALTLNDDIEFINYVNRKKKGIETNGLNIDTLALRGSTADYCFYPPAYKNSYNLGLTSSDLYTCYHLYYNYRNQLKNLKEVVLFMGVFVQGYSLINTVERYRSVTYSYFFNVPYMDESLIKKRYEKWIIKRCTSKGEVVNIKENDGYYQKSYYANNIKAEERVRGHLRENSRTPNQLEWFKKLAHLVHSDKRKLVVVFPPFRSDYKHLIPDSKEIYRDILGLNLKGIKYIDLTNENVVCDEDFGDTEHLYKQGAIKLTHRLYDILHSKS